MSPFPLELGKCVHRARKTAGTGNTNGTNDGSLNWNASRRKTTSPIETGGRFKTALGHCQVPSNWTMSQRAHLDWTTTPTFSVAGRFGGITSRWPNWRNRPHRRSLEVWTLARWTDKVNPFGTSPFFNGYKEESGWGGSLRIRERFATWQRRNAKVQAEWNFMSTFDDGDFALWESAVEQNGSDQLYDLNIRQTRTHWAPSVAMAWSGGWRLETSAALSMRTRSAKGVALDESYDAPFETWGLLPRIGMSKSLGNWGHWFVQASTGYSDPTNFESLSDRFGWCPLEST